MQKALIALILMTGYASAQSNSPTPTPHIPAMAPSPHSMASAQQPPQQPGAPNLDAKVTLTYEQFKVVTDAMVLAAKAEEARAMAQPTLDKLNSTFFPPAAPPAPPSPAPSPSP